MPSPLCSVRNGASATAQAAPPVAFVTPGATVTVALIDPSGANTWSLACTSADERITPSTITASLAVNPSTKTATFVAPSTPCALIFESVVNQGNDGNGRPDPLLRSRFKVAVPTVDGNALVALSETVEHHATFGWLSVLNDLLRGSLRLLSVASGVAQSSVDVASAKPIGATSFRPGALAPRPSEAVFFRAIASTSDAGNAASVTLVRLDTGAALATVTTTSLSAEVVQADVTSALAALTQPTIIEARLSLATADPSEAIKATCKQAWLEVGPAT